MKLTRSFLNFILQMNILFIPITKKAILDLDASLIGELFPEYINEYQGDFKKIDIKY